MYGMGHCGDITTNCDINIDLTAIQALNVVIFLVHVKNNDFDSMFSFRLCYVELEININGAMHL